MREEDLAVLMKMRLFAGFTREQLQTLAGKLRPRIGVFARGEVIWPMGAVILQAGIVLSGKVEAWHYSANGQGSLAAVHTAGGLFGDVLMSARTVGSPVELRVAQGARILFLPLETLLSNCAGGADDGSVRLLSNLLTEISEKYWALQKRVRCLEIPDGRTRLCAWLLDMQKQAERGPIRLALTREQMARRLGMNRCALSRLLGNLQREGLIACRRGEILVVNETALSQIAANV